MTIYVRSTDGNNGDNGSTWALAKATLAGAAAIDAAGDNIYVSQSHSESTASAVTLAFAGTQSNPVKIIAGNDAAEPPTTISTAAIMTTTGGNSHITIGGSIYMYGVRFNAGTTSTLSYILCGSASGDTQFYERCQFVLVNTAANAQITSNTSFAVVTWKNCDVKFADVGQSIQALSWVWDGGSVLSGGSSPTYLVALPSGYGYFDTTLLNLDLSNCGTGLGVFHAGTGVQMGNYSISDSKLPASWAGSLVGGTLGPGQRFSMYNCDNAGTNYKIWIQTYGGTIRDETTLVRSGGASDGTTALSWKMVTTANATYAGTQLRSDPIVVWNSTTGSSKTLTIEILRDSATNLTDAEIWLEADYFGASGNPQGTKITDAKADALATAADQTTSSETWTTTGMTNPNKQKLSVTFTPQLKGFFLCRVVVAKASTTVYVDPKITVS